MFGGDLAMGEQTNDFGCPVCLEPTSRQHQNTRRSSLLDVRHTIIWGTGISENYLNITAR